MSKPTGVSRRIEQSIIHLQKNDFEGALVNLFPAIDKTAKKRRSKDGVGKRVKAFLTDEEATISAIGTGNLFVNNRVDGITVPDALYKFGRTSIAHEGELDPRLNFNTTGNILIGREKWDLPISYITGMCIATIAAPENKDELISGNYEIDIYGRKYNINSLWGARQLIEQVIGDRFDEHSIFEKCRGA